MSVEGCYTDFHIDFGGTSVWYHILRGTKVSESTSSSTHLLQDELLTIQVCVCPGVLADPTLASEPGAL